MSILHRHLLLLAVALLTGLSLAGCRTTHGAVGATSAAAPASVVEPGKSVVRVAVTSQAYDFFRPWKKKGPGTREGLGTVIAGNRILVTARLVENATYIQLERLGSGERATATVEFVDYAVNLAVLKPDKAEYLAGMTPLSLVPTIKVGDKVTAWQFEANGSPFLTPGELRGVVMSSYPYGDLGYLVFRIEISLSQGDNSFTLPVVKDGQLAGLLMSYAADTKIMVLVPAPIIQHFLDDLADQHYDGFPVAGFNMSSLDDPQLQRFVKAPADGLGVFVDYVRPGSPVDVAGLHKGDVLRGVDNYPLDKHGEYADPDYGKLGLSYLLSTRSQVGQERVFHLLRDGKPVDVPVKLRPLRKADYPIRPYIIDEAPNYLIAGGLVMEELSRQLLGEWGGNWPQAAPHRLVYADAVQWELFKPGEHVVLLTVVLPSEYTTGYEALNFLPITAVNGQPIHSLQDVVAALGKPEKGFHKIEFKEQPYVIYLDASQMAADDAFIQKTYRLPALKRLTPPSAAK